MRRFESYSTTNARISKDSRGIEGGPWFTNGSRPHRPPGVAVLGEQPRSQVTGEGLRLWCSSSVNHVPELDPSHRTPPYVPEKRNCYSHFKDMDLRGWRLSDCLRAHRSKVAGSGQSPSLPDCKAPNSHHRMLHVLRVSVARKCQLGSPCLGQSMTAGAMNLG